MRRARIALFVLLCAAQLGAAVSMIVRYETALRSGARYQIEVAPVDPADAFRGRYVAIQPRLTAPVPPGEAGEALRRRLDSWNQSVYAILETDPEGFARVVRAVEDPPEGGDFLAATTGGPNPGGYALTLPFDRYYMKESAAPEAEQAYRKAAADREARRAWVVVRVRHGMGAVEGLYVDGVRIEDLVAAGAPATPRRD